MQKGKSSKRAYYKWVKDHSYSPQNSELRHTHLGNRSAKLQSKLLNKWYAISYLQEQPELDAEESMQQQAKEKHRTNGNFSYLTEMIQAKVMRGREWEASSQLAKKLEKSVVK